LADEHNALSSEASDGRASRRLPKGYFQSLLLEKPPDGATHGKQILLSQLFAKPFPKQIGYQQAGWDN
jgi:hypothetical protein